MHRTGRTYRSNVVRKSSTTRKSLTSRNRRSPSRGSCFQGKCRPQLGECGRQWAADFADTGDWSMDGRQRVHECQRVDGGKLGLRVSYVMMYCRRLPKDSARYIIRTANVTSRFGEYGYEDSWYNPSQGIFCVSFKCFWWMITEIQMSLKHL